MGKRRQRYLDFLRRRRRGRILRRSRTCRVRGLFLFKLLFLRRWFRRERTIWGIGDTISSISWL